MSGGFCSFSASARPDIFLNNRIRISNYRDCILVTAAILFVFFVFFVILTFFAAYAGNTSLAVSAVVTIISILGILFLLLDFTAGIYQIIAAVLIAVPLYNLQLFITVSFMPCLPDVYKRQGDCYDAKDLPYRRCSKFNGTEQRHAPLL